MKPTQQLHDLGQSLWLDNITRELLDTGTLARYVSEYSVTGLTSNPTIFDRAIASSDRYDDSIRRGARAGRAGDDLFYDLALEDLTRAADLFLPIHRATGGVDGWVSLEFSPLVAYDAAASLALSRTLHARAERPNLFIKIPGTEPGVRAIEDAIAAGVPVNVTLLFSPDQYRTAVEAYWRGIERRLQAGLDPVVPSVASLFVSRWDRAVAEMAPAELRNRLGIAVAMQTYRLYRELLASPRWAGLAAAGARPQRLLWGSTGTKDPDASDVLYVEALIAPDTINTMPGKTLLAFADHGTVGPPLPADGGDSASVLERFARLGVDPGTLARRLQREGAEAFAKSWRGLLEHLARMAENAEAGVALRPGR